MFFDLMHLSLIERKQLDAFQRAIGRGREEWLQSIFASPISFSHRGEIFHYVPEADPHLDVRPLIAARIGRQVSFKENEPPEAGLHETRRDAWLAANVLLDPTAHERGQRVAMEENGSVGKPFALLTSLAHRINSSDPPEPFALEVEPIIDASTFWDFVERNPGEVTSVLFELVTPNMFDGPEKMDSELRALREQERARRATIGLSNPDGLDLQTDRIRGIVDYAAKGGGSIEARARRRKTYSSKRKVKRMSVDVSRAPGSGTLVELLQTAKRIIFEL